MWPTGGNHFPPLPPPCTRLVHPRAAATCHQGRDDHRGAVIRHARGARIIDWLPRSRF